ncbi:hypothetical protein BJF90_23880 [Pseudonocardia sp. CNS-004]|nr:hypothetical protein BJF90_23880 [Pseudonocardia sp. CNS-004]
MVTIGDGDCVGNGDRRAGRLGLPRPGPPEARPFDEIYRQTRLIRLNSTPRSPPQQGRTVRAGIEIDSWAWHTDVDRFRVDRHKGSVLVRVGWTVLRHTRDDLTNRSDDALATTRAAMRAHGAGG